MCVACVCAGEDRVHDDVQVRGVPQRGGRAAAAPLGRRALPPAPSQPRPEVPSHINTSTYINTSIHTYHSRFITESVAETSEIFLRDSHVLPKLLSY
jgi:hypothetical protein